MFCHSAWLQISPARFKQVYSDKAVLNNTRGEIIILVQGWCNIISNLIIFSDATTTFYVRL